MDTHGTTTDTALRAAGQEEKVASRPRTKLLVAADLVLRVFQAALYLWSSDSRNECTRQTIKQRKLEHSGTNKSDTKVQNLA